MARQDELQDLININIRRLRILRKQRAWFGLFSPPQVSLEIEDIEAHLTMYRAELADLLKQYQGQLQQLQLHETSSKIDPSASVTHAVQQTQAKINGIKALLDNIDEVGRSPPEPGYGHVSFKMIVVGALALGLILIAILGLYLAFVSNLPPTRPTSLAVNVAPTTTTPALSTPTIEPMPKTGFNLAVAQFTTIIDPDDFFLLSPASKELSDWLFNTIVKRVGNLPPSYRVPIRGPKEIGPVIGQNTHDRNDHAARLASAHNATLLIYGVVARRADNIYLVQPEFYVSAQSFQYGDEIVGPNRLGEPVQFLPPLGREGVLQEINEDLDTRIEVLGLIAEGLVAFDIGHEDEAYGKFGEALNIPGWQPEEGQEVAHLLMGATKLRQYGKLVSPNPARAPHSFAEAQKVLAEAEQHFQQAYALNPDYARSYLGLGAVALYRATVFELEQSRVPKVDWDQLQQAKYWYSESLSSDPNQSPAAYVPVKAAYGLGLVYMDEYIQRKIEGTQSQPEESRAKAYDFFHQVLIAYNETGRSADLALLAGTARAYLALLAGHDNQYDTVISECEQAIEILNTLEADAPADQIANCNFWMALAYQNRSEPNLDAACRAYDQAIKIGQGSGLLAEDTLNQWRAARADSKCGGG